MCGICGIIWFDGRDADDAMFARMHRSMKHRGPDDYGQFLSGPVGLANLRLSIIDLKTGRQPIVNEDGNLVIVYNGEVYNYKELRARLPGHVFTTQSDTESILHAYEEWGVEALSQFNGMFALAIWNKRRRSLFLARDRMGVKPLYYMRHEKYFAFASEIKAFLHAGLDISSVDPISVQAYLAFKYVPTARTVYRDIVRLTPGQWIEIGMDGRMTSGRFWQYESHHDFRPRSEEDYAQELRTIVRRSVEDHMIADVPVGAFLSGGLDSGIVVTEMSRLTGETLKTFTVHYEEASSGQNESQQARAVALRVGAEHHTVSCDNAQALALLPRLIYHLDEPISEGLLAPSYLLAEAARRHVTVVLSGEGADELFAGYRRYKLSGVVEALAYLPGAMRLAAWRLADALLGEQAMVTRVLAASIDTTSISRWHDVFTPWEVETLCGSSEGADWIRQLLGGVASGRALLDFLISADTMFRLPEYILTRGDKMTMANSIEMRPPLLDNRIVDFALRVPPNLKLHKGIEKYILRKAFTSVIPDATVQRRKVPFSAPYANWLPELCRRYLADMHYAQAGFMRQSEVDRVVARRRYYRGRLDEKLLSLIVLEIWFRIFIDRSLSVESKP